MHEKHAGRAADCASAMAATADIIGEKDFTAAASVLFSVAGFDLQCAGQHDKQLTPRGWMPVLIEASGISVTIVLCAGRMAKRRTVLPNASVDALSIGISSSTNCDPPSSDAEAKRTIFIRVLRIARNWALVYLSG